jgi:hypothetical protein
VNVDGGHLAQADGDFIAAHPRILAADDRAVGHLNLEGEHVIAPGPAAGLE